MTQIACPICSNEQWNISFTAKERLIWTREIFNYIECVSCKCVFLKDEIKDFSPYYPKWYHCFDDSNYPNWKKFLLKKLYQYNFRGRWLIGNITYMVFMRLYGHKPEQNITRIAYAAKHILWEINYSNIKTLSLLDLGCWSWLLLKQLQDIWFKHLTWVEPFWNPKLDWIKFINSNFGEYLADSWNKKYDIIVMSHVLEHLYDHHAIIKWLKKMLNKKWVIIIAMPFTWKLFDKFREFTMSLDAPRHVIMHSTKSFRDLVINNWLSVLNEWYEQKWRDVFASEMYSRDIWFSEIKDFNIKDTEKLKHQKIAEVYNEQKEWWSHVTFFITH